jgi:hypothetical protein
VADRTTADITATTSETAAPPTTAVETTTPAASDYSIGEKGPAGGLIFYINPNYATDGWKYLEAAPSDCQGEDNDYRITWYNGTYPETGATATAMGTGMSNTQKIVDIQGNGSYAAKLCSDLTQGGCNDWFLPSKDELNLMFENLYLKGLGSFEPDFYWSSSEYAALNAWYQYFEQGYQSNNNFKINYTGRGRAVRAF